jgi:hypothetical protein
MILWILIDVCCSQGSARALIASLIVINIEHNQENMMKTE